ncbi:AAA family ATPase [Actinomadura gamaensis]|uniref:AAA family ATPase n=1 Tax=Actinomadura gamaensis TaxID=1763541 RepID=A0ABV9U6S6_9ACTN
MTATKPRPGWQSERLRERRQSLGWTLEAAGDQLQQIGHRHGLRIEVDLEGLWGHETGTVYPGPHHRRAYCLMYGASEPDLGFRLPLPREITTEPTAATPVPDSATAQVTTEEAEHTLNRGLDRITDASHDANSTAGDGLKDRVVAAWRSRTLSDDPNKPVLVLVGGYAGSGKTEFARFLSSLTGWAILDKDSITRRLTERLLESMGGDRHDRHTDLYIDHVRRVEYKCLMDTADDNVDCGVSSILIAPFTLELNDEAWLSRLTNRCRAKGVDVAAIWVRCDVESMREYIEFRDAPRDAWKLSHWEQYTAGLNTQTSPPGVHLTIDNRLGAAISIADQTREALRKILA